MFTPEQIAVLRYKDIDAMTGDEYKQHLSDPAFVKRAEEVLAAQPKKPARA